MSLSNAIFDLYALEAEAHEEQIEWLKQCLDLFENSGSTSVLSDLSSGERAAVLLAGKRDADLNLPVNAFLQADPHLQKWIMEKRGFSNQVGWPLGEIPSFA